MTYILQKFSAEAKALADAMNIDCDPKGRGKLAPPGQLKGYTEYLASYQMLDSDKALEIPGKWLY